MECSQSSPVLGAYCSEVPVVSVGYDPFLGGILGCLGLQIEILCYQLGPQVRHLETWPLNGAFQDESKVHFAKPIPSMSVDSYIGHALHQPFKACHGLVLYKLVG